MRSIAILVFFSLCPLAFAETADQLLANPAVQQKLMDPAFRKSPEFKAAKENYLKNGTLPPEVQGIGRGSAPAGDGADPDVARSTGAAGEIDNLLKPQSENGESRREPSGRTGSNAPSFGAGELALPSDGLDYDTIYGRKKFKKLPDPPPGSYVPPN